MRIKILKIVIATLIMIFYGSAQPYVQNNEDFFEFKYHNENWWVSYFDNKIRITNLDNAENILEQEYYSAFESILGWNSILLKNGKVQNYYLDDDLLFISVKEVNNRSHILVFNLKTKRVVNYKWAGKSGFFLSTSLAFAFYDFEKKVLITSNLPDLDENLRLHYFKISEDKIEYLKDEIIDVSTKSVFIEDNLKTLLLSLPL